MNNYKDRYQYFLNRNIYGLQADASDAIGNIKEAMLGIGRSTTDAFTICEMICHLFTNASLSQKECDFIVTIFSNNGFRMDIARFKSVHSKARANSEDTIKNTVKFCADNLDSRLHIFLSVLAVATAAVKGFIGTMDEIYYCELVDGWERYY